MPDPAKVKAVIIGSVLVIGASVGIGIGVSKRNNNNFGAVVENMNSVTPRNADETAYEDSAPTNVEDTLDEIVEQPSARYGGYKDYGSNPFEGDRTWSDDVDDDGGGWTDDGWDDDGWNDVSIERATISFGMNTFVFIVRPVSNIRTGWSQSEC
jgi:hypothetical protein